MQERLVKLLTKLMRDTADKIDAGNCELSADEAMDETLNYLDDADNPYGTEKVWKYLNS